MKHLASMTWKTVGVVALSALLCNPASADLSWVDTTPSYAANWIEIPNPVPPGSVTTGPSLVPAAPFAITYNSPLGINVDFLSPVFGNAVFASQGANAYINGYFRFDDSLQRLSPFGTATVLGAGSGVTVSVWYDSGMAVIQWKNATVNTTPGNEFEMQIFANDTPHARFLYKTVAGTGGANTSIGYLTGSVPAYSNTYWTGATLASGSSIDLIGSANGGTGGGGGANGDNANGGVGAPEPGTVLMGLSALAMVGVPLVFRRRRA